MAIIKAEVCVCDICGHQWFTHARPKRCAKCKTPRWDHKATGTYVVTKVTKDILEIEAAIIPTPFHADGEIIGGIPFQNGPDIKLKKHRKPRSVPFKKEREYESAFVILGRVLDEEQPKLRAALEPHHPRCTCWTCKPPKS